MKNTGVVVMVLVALICLEVGNNTLFKATTSKGMSDFVFIVYSNSLAMFFLLPLTFGYHKLVKPIPPISFSIVCKIFLLALCCSIIQITTYVGIRYSSPTLSSAISNLNPAFTFILAILTRMEKLNMKTRSSQAMSIGTIISMAGAFVINFYKGPLIFPCSDSSTVEPHILPTSHSNWTLGGFLTVIASFSMAVMYIILAWITKDYPAELMVTLISSMFMTMQSTLVGLIVEWNPCAWKLTIDLELATIMYTGVNLVLTNVVYAWVVRLKGPVFVTTFTPLGMVIAIVFGVTLLGDALHFGSVIGAAIIALGFYFVMWGKANQLKALDDDEDGVSSSHKAPLLPAKSSIDV